MGFFSITSRLRSSKLGMTKSNNDLSHSASNCEITLHFKDLVVFCTPAPQRKSFSVNTVYLSFYINEKYCLLRKSVYFSVLSTRVRHTFVWKRVGAPLSNSMCLRQKWKKD